MMKHFLRDLMYLQRVVKNPNNKAIHLQMIVNLKRLIEDKYEGKMKTKEDNRFVFDELYNVDNTLDRMRLQYWEERENEQN